MMPTRSTANTTETMRSQLRREDLPEAGDALAARLALRVARAPRLAALDALGTEITHFQVHSLH